MNGKEIIALLSGAALTGCYASPISLQEALDDLAETNPTEEHPVMTCYEVIEMPKKQQVYMCPVCGKETVFKAGSKGAEAVEELRDEDAEFSTAAQAKMKEFGIAITVDDTEFCKFCSKTPAGATLGLIPCRQWVFFKTDATGKPIPETEWRVYRRGGDHDILEAFFEGKDTIGGEMGGAFALKTYIPRLAKLLKLKQ